MKLGLLWFSYILAENRKPKQTGITKYQVLCCWKEDIFYSRYCVYLNIVKFWTCRDKKCHMLLSKMMERNNPVAENVIIKISIL